MQNHHHHQQQQLQEEEEEENYPTFRWFDLLLSLVAGVVAVLAMAVLVEAVMVMRARAQQYQLEIMVVHGAVLVELRPQPPVTLNFHFVASNPITNRPSKVSFTNIEISVRDSRNTSMPEHFRVEDYIVGLMPGNTTDVLWSQTPDNPKVNLGSYFFEKLKKNESTLINLRLQGTLTTEFFPFNGAGDGPTLPKTATAIYSCDGVVLEVDSYLSNTIDVRCSYINS